MAHIRVLNHYMHSKFLVLGALEFFLLVGAVLIGAEIKSLISGVPIYLESPDIQLFTFAAVLSCCSLAMGVYASILREGLVAMFLRTIVSFFFLGTASLTVLYYFFPVLYLGQGVLVFAILTSVVLVVSARFMFFRLVDIAQLTRNVVFLGAGETTSHILDRIAKVQGGLSFKVFGCIPADVGDVQVKNVSILAKPKNWIEFSKQNDISEIVVAPDERRRSEGGNIPVDDLLNCKLKGIRVTEPLDFMERELHRIEISMLRPGWAIFSEGFSYSQVRDVFKRCFDLGLALFIFLLVWPFMLLTAFAILLETGRPILYHQTRIGYNGKEFKIYKFRSMTQDAEKDGKAVWAKKNDARVTRVGSFIRNTRLDELPQLYNVFRGDMSFVGPRPERPQFVDELKEVIPYYDARHKVKPGLMGWAQLKYPYGASVQDARNKLKYDLYYVKNHSFFLDVLIVIQTVEVVLLGKGVH